MNIDLTGKTIQGRYKVKKNVNGTPLFDKYRACGADDSDMPFDIIVMKNSVVSSRRDDIIRYYGDVNAVKSLKHPGIVNIFEADEFLGLHYIVVEPFSGDPLAAIIKREELSLSQILNISKTILETLSYLHENGIVHRWLVPDAVLVDDDTSVLTGFGIAHIVNFERLSADSLFLESLNCASPELTGMIRTPVDARTDLYSFGIILYRLLTGVYPFNAGDPGEILYRHAAVEPIPPSRISGDISEEIDSIVLKLLRKDPSLRYQNAVGVLKDFKRLKKYERNFISGYSAEKVINKSYAPELSGRDRELAVIENTLIESMSGHTAICFVQGPAGIGKSAFLKEAGRLAEVHGALPLYSGAEAYTEEAPYSLFRGFIHSFMAAVKKYDDIKLNTFKQTINSSVRDFGSLIVNLHPPLGDLLDHSSVPLSIDPERESARFRSALTNFFKAFCSQEKSVIFIVDDIHNFDEETLLLFEEMLREMQGMPVTALCSFPEQESDYLPFFRMRERLFESVPVNAEIKLPYLDESGVRLIVEDILSEKSDTAAEIASRLYMRSLGNPLFVNEILKLLISGNVITKDRGLRFDKQTFDNSDIPDSLAGIILRNTENLNDQEKRLFSCAALSGKKFSYSILILLKDFHGMNDDSILYTLERAVGIHLLEKESAEEKDVYKFSHEYLRSSFLGLLDQGSVMAVHRTVAEHLKNQDDKEDMLFDLVEHCLQSGDREGFVKYGIMAGHKAKKMYAYDHARTYFEIAEFQLERNNTDNEKLLMCIQNSGEIALVTGRYDEAVSMFNKAADLSPDILSKADAYKKISSAYYRKGDWINCEKSAVKGLVFLGERSPVTSPGVTASIFWQFLFRFVNVAATRVKGLKKNKTVSEKERLIIEIYEILNMAYMLSRPFKMVRTVLRMINIAQQRMGLSREYARALYNYGGLLMSVSFYKSAKPCLDRSLALNRSLGYLYGEAQNLQLFGYYHEWKADYRRGLDSFNESMKLFERIGDIKEQCMVLNGMCHCYYYRGEYDKALEINDRYYRIVKSTGDLYSESAACIYYSQIYRETGDMERADSFAFEARDISRKNNIWFNYCSSLIELGLNSIEKSDIKSAINYLEEARDLYSKNTFLKQYIVHLFSALAYAYILSFQLDTSEADKRINMKKADRLSRIALKHTRKLPTHYPAALRVRAIYESLNNNSRKANRLFLASIDRAGDRMFEAGHTHFEYGLLLSQNNEKVNALNHIESAYLIFEKIGAQRYRSLVSGFLGIWDESEGYFGSLQRISVRERESAIEKFIRELSPLNDKGKAEIISRAAFIAGAQRGYIFMRDKKGEPVLKSSYPEEAGLFDMRLKPVIDHVFSAGKAEYGTLNPEEPSWKTTDNVDIPNLFLSYLCVPFEVAGEVCGVCLLENKLIREAFTDADGMMLQSYLKRASAVMDNKGNDFHEIPVFEEREVSPATKEKINRVISYIDKDGNYLREISRDGLAALVNMHPDNLGKTFKNSMGKSISEYINEKRINDAARRLLETDDPVIDIAFSTGFESLRTFNRVFSKAMGCTPRNYRKMKN